MVTGVNSSISGNMSSSRSSSGILSPGSGGVNAAVSLNGISLIEPVKRTGDNRRSNKPIMEKRRRARINNCLNELKALILDATKKDPRHSKLEKADILEKTVKYLQDLQRQQMLLTQATDPAVINKFKAGFAECATEVGRFGGIEPAVKRRLLQHLSNCLNGVKSSPASESSSSSASSSAIHNLPSPPSSPDQSSSSDKLMCGRHPAPASGGSFNQISLSSSGYFLSNGNGGVGVQVIPTKLSNGNIAFVVPPGALQYQSPSSSPTSVQGSSSSSSSNSAPMPMLIPIPVAAAAAARQTVASASSSTSPSPSSSETVHGSGSSSSRCSSNSSSHISHVTSSPYPYERSTGTPSSAYGSMSPVNSQHGCASAVDATSTSSSSSSSSSTLSRKRSRSCATEDCDQDERESECHSPVPLSLVVRKVALTSGDEDADKQCWRPW